MHTGMVILEGRSQSTSIYMRWSPLFPNLFYFISIENLNSSIDVSEVVLNATNNATSFNVTGLLPGTTYELTLVVVCTETNTFNTSNVSTVVIRMTGLTG